MNFLSKVKNFDIYRDIPKDLTEQTLTGAIVSIICYVCMVFLFLAEFISYLTPEVRHTMYVDNAFDAAGHGVVQINLNITTPACPCALLSVDLQDVMGGHIVDQGGQLQKRRLRRDSLTPIADSFGRDGDPLAQKGEGCNVWGYMTVKRVPGNFHLSAHAHTDLLGQMLGSSNLNMSHIINDLSFGRFHDKDIDLGDWGLSPLKKVAKMDTDPNGKVFEYYVKIIPMRYERYGKVYDTYQYTANSNELGGMGRLTAVYFRYDLSPIAVQVTKQSKSFSHFLVQVCAIVGGVFTVLGLVNSVLHSSLKHFLKKAEMGKLG